MSQTSINLLDVIFSLIGGKVTSDLCIKPTHSHQYFHSLIYATNITPKREFRTAKLFVLIESVQILILLMEDAIILKKWLIDRVYIEREV